jgi:hypothetical protein
MAIFSSMDNKPDGSDKDRTPPLEKKAGSEPLKMAANPDPRANENLKSAPGEKQVTGAGSEITDGEAG